MRSTRQRPTQDLSSASVRTLRWRFFFAHFFSILLVCISIAQWGIPLWVLASIVPAASPLKWDWPLHVLMPFFFFLMNLALLYLLRRTSYLPPLLHFPLRLYFAYGVTTVFCFVFLLLCSAAWLVLWAAYQTLGIAVATTVTTIERVQTSSWEILLWVTNLGIGTITTAFVYGYVKGYKQVKITHLTLALSNWPQTWSGLKLLHLSDLHIGSNLSLTELQRYITCANALTPDLVFLTGDLLDASPAYIPQFFPLLNQLTARYGVFACLGNHDTYAGAQAVAEGLARYTHITLLRDQTTSLTIKGASLHIVGLNDRGKDWARGLDTLPFLSHLRALLPFNEPCILLSHRPDLFPQAAREGIVLTLSGHTHGGQIALPGWQGRMNLARFITYFSRGLYSAEDKFLYVNRGLGVTGQRVRIFTPREIALLTCVPQGYTSIE